MARLALGYTAALIVLLLLADFGVLRPLGQFVNSVPTLDKLLHFLMYGGMALLANAALSRRPRWSLIGAIATGSIGVVIVSTVEEYSNLFTPCRAWSLTDLAANYLGIACLGVLPLVYSTDPAAIPELPAAAITPDRTVTDSK
jgi:VanZ family protein